jgi:hypothetical protein
MSRASSALGTVRLMTARRRLDLRSARILSRETVEGGSTRVNGAQVGIAKVTAAASDPGQDCRPQLPKA